MSISMGLYFTKPSTSMSVSESTCPAIRCKALVSSHSEWWITVKILSVLNCSNSSLHLTRLQPRKGSKNTKSSSKARTSTQALLIEGVYELMSKCKFLLLQRRRRLTLSSKLKQLRLLITTQPPKIAIVSCNKSSKMRILLSFMTAWRTPQSLWTLMILKPQSYTLSSRIQWKVSFILFPRVTMMCF